MPSTHHNHHQLIFKGGFFGVFFFFQRLDGHGNGCDAAVGDSVCFHGGPGCSSLGVGAFSENGPFRPNGQGLVRNEYSWNTEANMLYLETPVGVGFSYDSSNSSAYEVVTDVITARDNLVFLHKWFLKFPQYKQRDLFITGESYAGHYIPQLAELIVRFNKKQKLFNLKGIALGNPVLEYATDLSSRAEYFWSHGLISDSTYKLFTSACNYSRYVSEYYRDSVSPICAKVYSLVSKETSRFVDKYDVTLDVCIPSVLSQSKIISPQQVTERVDVCMEDETVNYLNRRDVRRALHARLLPTINIVGSLIKEGIQVLVYSGDQDSVIPLMGSRALVHGLATELGLKTTVPYRAWFEGPQQWDSAGDTSLESNDSPPEQVTEISLWERLDDSEFWGVVFFALFKHNKSGEFLPKEATTVIKIASSRMATQSVRLGYEFAKRLGVRTPQARVIHNCSSEWLKIKEAAEKAREAAVVADGDEVGDMTCSELIEALELSRCLYLMNYVHGSPLMENSSAFTTQ
ncbi:hypothetical protein L6452_09047 [Arctium lappa]|uniref:Uncharacterized protein n=1 Tax=Arctium lappa TaxID=4217 RepID=A0ACB9DJ96_ARCLA|nr:hypothetical protein L6452_09047 [Arctium lappa]